MLQRQFRVHVLEPSVFFFQLTQAANVGGFHATVLCLPFVVGGVADFVFATNVSDGLARLDGFQDGDDLRLAEFALSHSASWRHTRPETSTFQWPGFKGGLQRRWAVPGGVSIFLTSHASRLFRVLLSRCVVTRVTKVFHSWAQDRGTQ